MSAQQRARPAAGVRSQRRCEVLRRRADLQSGCAILDSTGSSVYCCAQSQRFDDLCRAAELFDSRLNRDLARRTAVRRQSCDSPTEQRCRAVRFSAQQRARCCAAVQSSQRCEGLAPELQSSGQQGTPRAAVRSERCEGLCRAAGLQPLQGALLPPRMVMCRFDSRRNKRVVSRKSSV